MNSKLHTKTDKSGNTILESYLGHNHKKYKNDIMMRQVIYNSLNRKSQENIYELE